MLFTFGGMAFGMVASGFMPHKVHRLVRLAPFFSLGVVGIFIDDYRIRETCRVCIVCVVLICIDSMLS